MTTKRFKVLLNAEIVAENMDIDTALMLVKALFEKYCYDYDMVISIREMGCARCGK